MVLKKITPIVLSVALLTAGCSNLSETEQRVLSGTALGAAGGAVIGGVTGSSMLLATGIGAGVGAGLGYLYDQDQKGRHH